MSLLDWIIIFFYTGGLVVLGWWLGLRQKSAVDYYLAGRRLHWLPIGFIMTSSIIPVGSLITQSLHRSAFEVSIPAQKRIWKANYTALTLYVILLILFLVFFPKIFL